MTEEHIIRALEFYSGIGGLHLALARSQVNGSVIRAYDWDQSACQVYQKNHGPGIVKKADILLLTATELRTFNAELWLLSPSCQPYTVLNPLAKGAEDPRAKYPRYMLVENVAGFETSSTRLRLLHILDKLGYACSEFLLTPLQFGIPNSRLRYYLLAKWNPLKSTNTPVEAAAQMILRHIPGQGGDWLDPRDATERIYDVQEVRRYLDDDLEGSDFRISDRVLEKWGRLFDIVLPSARRTCCFTRGYTKLAERAGSVLQMNEELDGSADAVRLLDPLRLRYFSPSELLRLFCFELPRDSGPESFTWPDAISTKTKYKLIGNSVNVEVVRHLIEYLFA
ncbi:hypothetical protein PHLGIDRAFT_25806 [Phlebiopsis gigantea 11061_1 CR5-6]|uniref:tRNA (cytosine(38)-C(5))-methyltransferase n=1 Tax=Phlebiopsis gigantea (strain 11061_1 CR5-6) TaxID=745531 RepID=A0A0C3S2W0_PHLG1|nr:hypothetical protein PHLGIDRAFT_25806 [Phlebiopsis gigantea 11061_1 CR5-6]